MGIVCDHRVAVWPFSGSRILNGLVILVVLGPLYLLIDSLGDFFFLQVDLY